MWGVRGFLLSRVVICFYLLSILLLVVGSSGTTQAREKRIKLRFYYHASPQGGQARFLKAWIEKIEKASNGKLDISFFPGASLGPPMEAYKMIESGAVDMGCVVKGFYPGRFPLSEVILLPFMGFPNGEIGSLVYWDLHEKFQEIRDEYTNIKVLVLYTDAPTPIGSNKAIRVAEDLKGLKIRALSGSPTEILKELGAYPVLMSTGEIYTSMERNLLDGWMFSWEGCIGQRLEDVTKYFTTANAYQSAMCVLMNQSSWDNLPPDIQKVINEHSGRAGASFFGREFDRFTQIGIEKIKKMRGKEIITLTPEEAKRWKNICQPIEDKWLADMEAKGLPGKAVLDEAQKLLEKYTEKNH
jgi:TRAP-type C4-dicarboxylate transport system substrate-binding protein